jgi:2-polyprenyl-6-hydroxyphenyl methylase/3-demethylubiquinone-9 3-methyltransferase
MDVLNLVSLVGAEYIMGWLPRGTHQWARFMKPAELERSLETNGLRISARTGVRVNPLTRAFSLTSDESINFMLIATKRAGRVRSKDAATPQPA